MATTSSFGSEEEDQINKAGANGDFYTGQCSCNELSRHIVTLSEATSMALSRTTELDGQYLSLHNEIKVLQKNQDMLRDELRSMRSDNQKLNRQLGAVLDLLNKKISDDSSTRESISSAENKDEKSNGEIKRSASHAEQFTSTPEQSGSNHIQCSLTQVSPLYPSHGLTSPRHFSGDGKEHFDDFLQHFKAVTSLNNWDEKTAALQLEVSLEGHARKLALELEEADRRSYKKLVAHMKKRLTNRNSECDYVRSFYARERGSNESPADFVIGLQKLAKHAFPGRDEHEVEVLIKRQMVKGYGDSNVAVALAIENKDCSIWDLVNRAVEVSEVLHTPKSAAMRKPTVAPIDAKKKETANAVDIIRVMILGS